MSTTWQGAHACVPSSVQELSAVRLSLISHGVFSSSALFSLSVQAFKGSFLYYCVTLSFGVHNWTVYYKAQQHTHINWLWNNHAKMGKWAEKVWKSTLWVRETRRDACQVSLRLRERENEKGVVSFISHFYRDRCKFHLQPPDFHGIVSHFGPFSFLVFNFGFLFSIRFESRLSSSTLFCIVFLLTPVILKKSLFSFFFILLQIASHWWCFCRAVY